MSLCCCVIPLLFTAMFTFILFTIIVRLLNKRKPNIVRHESEKFYLNARTGEKCSFPFNADDEDEKLSAKNSAEVYLSVIIPAYNEQTRLPTMLDETIKYLEERCQLKMRSPASDAGKHLPSGEQFTYEIIIVDDGSTDSTTRVALAYNKEYGCEKIRVLTLQRNRGKGGAVRLGMLSARGELLLLVDADGATTFTELEKLERYVHETAGDERQLADTIAIGSRKHLEKESIAERSIFRTFLMYGFHFLVWFLTVKRVGDTQCGFKLFGRRIGQRLFRSMHVERWAFDVELLFLAERLNARIGEIAVQWKEIDGSKIVPVFSWLQMGKDVLIISFMYRAGAWTTPSFKLAY